MARSLSLLVVLGAAVALFAADATAATARLTGVRHLSGLNYTRVIFDVTGPVQYTVHTLPADPANGLSPRIYLDISGARARRSRVNVGDRLVRRVRIDQNRPGVVRAVLDLKHPGTPDHALMANPHRIVVDVERATGAGRRYPAVRKIVLDPGHGGKDPGAVGVGGLREKDVVLQVARRLAPRLRDEMGVDVVLTRTRDEFVPLKERTELANREDADLFVSIHSNASPNQRAGGLETYHLDKTADEATRRLVARENSDAPVTGVARRDLEAILTDLVEQHVPAYMDGSRRLARYLQSSLVKHTRRRYPRAKDLGVKRGPFYVLVSHMPAALVELFFVSNRREARELQRPEMHRAIVDGLSRGIKNYADAPRKR